jgi:Arc/MetJ-type ribon-helix-helix transcriptional regulator
MKNCIMIISLSKELEQFVHHAVRVGRYAADDDVVRDALIRLKQTIPKNTEMAGQRAKPAQQKKPLTIEQVHQRMLASGLITQLPDPAQDIDDDDPDGQPVVIDGESLSESIIRERR